MLTLRIVACTAMSAGPVRSPVSVKQPQVAGPLPGLPLLPYPCIGPFPQQSSQHIMVPGM